MGPKLTQAEGMILGAAAKMFFCCSARHLPASTALLGICRPRPLAQVTLSATGALPLLPIAGPVIVYGVSASVVYGLIYWVTTLF